MAVPNIRKNDHPKHANYIPFEGMIIAQKDDLKFQNCSALIGLPLRLFDFGNYGILVRCSLHDGSFKNIIALALRERIISLSHEPLCQGHTFVTKTYRTMRHRFYWPFMVGDISVHIQKSCPNAIAKYRCRKKQYGLNLFPPICFPQPELSTISQLASSDCC